MSCCHQYRDYVPKNASFCGGFNEIDEAITEFESRPGYELESFDELLTTIKSFEPSESRVIVPILKNI